jgi:hypothetical protein
MWVLPQAVEIIFEVQRKRSNEKITRKKKSFSTYKKRMFFFFSFLFGPLLLLNLIIFYFLFILNNLKCYKNIPWSFTNHFSTNNNGATYKEFFECLGTGLCNVWSFFFWSFWPLLLWRVVRFLNSISFLTIFNVPNVSIGRVQALLRHRRQQSSPLGSGLRWALTCSVTGWFTLRPTDWSFTEIQGVKFSEDSLGSHLRVPPFR